MKCDEYVRSRDILKFFMHVVDDVDSTTQDEILDSIFKTSKAKEYAKNNVMSTKNTKEQINQRWLIDRNNGATLSKRWIVNNTYPPSHILTRLLDEFIDVPTLTLFEEMIPRHSENTYDFTKNRIESFMCGKVERKCVKHRDCPDNQSCVEMSHENLREIFIDKYGDEKGKLVMEGISMLENEGVNVREWMTKILGENEGDEVYKMYFDTIYYGKCCSL